MYAASACLVLVLIIMGVSMINSFDRMKSVQNTLDTLAGAADKVETQETSGTVTAVTEEQGGEGQAGDGQTSGDLDADNSEDADSGQEDLTSGDNAGTSANTSGNDSGTSSSADVYEAAGAAGGGSDGSGQIIAAPGENGSDGVYIVEEGDTLAIISRKMYGDVTHVDAICKMNGITDGNLIYVGQKLLLP